MKVASTACRISNHQCKKTFATISAQRGNPAMSASAPLSGALRTSKNAQSGASQPPLVRFTVDNRIGTNSQQSEVAYFPRYHYTPYATEQGISKQVSGNLFQGTGNFLGAEGI
jgi:hypothetical protein